jgi:hypothetical protein
MKRVLVLLNRGQREVTDLKDGELAAESSDETS